MACLIPARRMAARTVLLAMVTTLCAASMARAGQYTVTFDAYANQQPGCSIWTISGSTQFGYNPPCGGAPLGFYAGGAGPGSARPAGARIGMHTTAPPGVSITNAFVSPYFVDGIDNNQGWGGGSYTWSPERRSLESTWPGPDGGCATRCRWSTRSSTSSRDTPSGRRSVVPACGLRWSLAPCCNPPRPPRRLPGSHVLGPLSAGLAAPPSESGSTTVDCGEE